MQVFDPQTFRQFVGLPTFHKKHNWGVEERYVISEASLTEYENLFRDTLYHHHTSFDVLNEVTALGYPLAARAMHQRNSGNPRDDSTQMGNLGEVIGTEFARAFLGFETALALPKRLNTNIDQSMKGADIIGLRDDKRFAELLIGEAKCSKRSSKSSICEAYDQLVDLQAKEASRMLRCIKEYLILKQDRQGLVNVDRHMAHGVPRRYMILSVTQSAPQDPFDLLAEKSRCVQLPGLIAAHIQIHSLRGRKTQDGQRGEETWLSSLFTP